MKNKFTQKIVGECGVVVIANILNNNKVPNKSLRGTEYTHFSQFPDQWGKGEWTAKTLDEAREMAIDFAKEVS